MCLNSIKRLCFVLVASLIGCNDAGEDGGAGTSSGAGAGGAGGAGGGGPHVSILHPHADPLPGESECEVVITTEIPATAPVKHVPVCARPQYATEPPTWGDHWVIWSAYKKYKMAVPREMYVHNQEHGGVVLSYRCDGPCPEVVGLLEQVFDEVPDDPLCFKELGAPGKRMVLTPSDAQTAPIVASAWNASYTATCIDKASLADFVSAAYGKGTEETCTHGVDPEDRSQGYLDCGDGSGGGSGGGGDGGSGGSGSGGAGGSGAGGGSGGGGGGSGGSGSGGAGGTGGSGGTSG